MLRPVAPDPDLIEWLWSAEGRLWHREAIRRVAHAHGWFAEVKEDHECYADDCEPYPFIPHADGIIASDLKAYGISGVPVEWKLH